MNQVEFQAITCNFFFFQSAGKIARTGCDWSSLILSLIENWREVFEPTTKRVNRNRLVAFDC